MKDPGAMMPKTEVSTLEQLEGKTDLIQFAIFKTID